MTAIRMAGIGRYFDAALDLDGQDSRAALRGLLGVFGVSTTLSPEDIRRTRLIGGQVLRDVSLTIEMGSIVCLRGASGSGKSTLLRILAGALPPTEGRAEIHGRIASLLQVGENLDGGRTGLQNIENQSRLIGLDRADYARFARAVLDFAELPAGFEAVPVERYSSGMKLRLSLALILEAPVPIFLIDDVIAVGDIAFQQKCVDRLVAMKEAGATIVTAISDDDVVRQIATRIVTLAQGTIANDEFCAGDIETESTPEYSWQIASAMPGNEVARMTSVECALIPSDKGPALDVRLETSVDSAPQRIRPLVDVIMGRSVVFRSIFPDEIVIQQPGLLRTRIQLPIHLLGEGRYSVDLSVVSRIGHIVHILKSPGTIRLDVRRSRTEDAPAELQSPVLAAVFRLEGGPLPNHPS